MPPSSIEGSKTPAPLSSIGDQVPPGSGVPPKLSNKSTMELLVHKSIEPFVPAIGCGDTVTVTVDDCSEHVLIELIVYV